MQTKKIKNQKPNSLDIHLRYRCANEQCYGEHWLTLLETQTKNFKVVCDCGTIFKPKRIKTVKLVYLKEKQKDVIKKEKTSLLKDKDISIIKKAIPGMVSFGFTEKESEDILTKTYIKIPTEDISLLIKNTLLEVRNNGECSETV